MDNIYSEINIIMNIDKIIEESINKVIRETVVDRFTPYTPEEAEQNKRGVGRMGNPSYDSMKIGKRIINQKEFLGKNIAIVKSC